MDRAAIAAAIKLSDEHIAVGERHIAMQRGMIEGLKKDGHRTTEAERTLQTYEAALALHRAHREQLSAQLEADPQ
jgi:hypothetical protein